MKMKVFGVVLCALVALFAAAQVPSVAPLVIPQWTDLFTPGTAYSNAATNWALQVQGDINALAAQGNSSVSAVQNLQARVGALETAPAPSPSPSGGIGFTPRLSLPGYFINVNAVNVVGSSITPNNGSGVLLFGGSSGGSGSYFDYEINAPSAASYSVTASVAVTSGNAAMVFHLEAPGAATSPVTYSPTSSGPVTVNVGTLALQPGPQYLRLFADQASPGVTNWVKWIHLVQQ